MKRTKEHYEAAVELFDACGGLPTLFNVAEFLAERDAKDAEFFTRNDQQWQEVCGALRAELARGIAECDGLRREVARLSAMAESLTKERNRYLGDIDRITENGVRLLNMRIDDIMDLTKERDGLLGHVETLREELRLARGAVCFWASNSGSPDHYLRDLKRLDAVLEDTAPLAERIQMAVDNPPTTVFLDDDGNPCGDCTFHGTRCMFHAAEAALKETP